MFSGDWSGDTHFVVFTLSIRTPWPLNIFDLIAEWVANHADTMITRQILMWLYTGCSDLSVRILRVPHSVPCEKVFSVYFDSEHLDKIYRLVRPAKTQISLRIRAVWTVSADCICLLQPPGYPKRDQREPLPYWIDVQADLSLYWLHRSYLRFCRALIHKPAHVKTCNKTFATSEDSQTALPRSLIRVFADRMCFLQPTGYLNRDKRVPFHRENMPV